MRDKFIHAMSLTASSVYVVTTDGPAGRRGVTVSAVSSISADPNRPTLMACIHHESPTATAILDNKVFCINLLAHDQADISDVFAGRTGKTGEAKFEDTNWETDATGSPILQNALAAFDCNLHHEMRIGSHHVFIGELAAIQHRDAGAPLLYGGRGYLRASQINES